MPLPMPEEEERLWQLDVRMNAFGVRVDTGLIKGALYVDDVLSGLCNEWCPPRQENKGRWPVHRDSVVVHP